LIGLLLLFLNNLVPIFLAAGSGYALGKWLKVTPRSISQIIFYVFSPCLIFNLLTQSKLSSQEVGQIMGFGFVLMISLGLLTWGAGQLIRMNQKFMVAVLLTSMFMNAGNFGLPVTLFAFGETALAYASLFFTASSVTMNSLGVLIASSGSQGFQRALVGLLKLPMIYGLLLGLLFVQLDRQLPQAISRAVTILGDAAVPTMLVLLGVQLSNMRWNGSRRALALATTMRLVVSPLLALAISRLFNLQGVAYQAGIIEAAMPSAVLNTVLATEFNVEPEFVTAVVFTTTILSPLTLTPLMAFLGA
jgi:hypothetical protein